MEQTPITLTDIAGGAAVERFEDELQRVLENIADPNTEAEANRTVTLKFTFHPDKDRGMAGVALQSSCKLAPMESVGTNVFIAQGKGTMVACEYNPKQLQLDMDDEAKPVPIDGGKP